MQDTALTTTAAHSGDEGTFQLPVDVIGEILCNLESTALGSRLLKPRHAIEGEDGEAEQGNSQSQRKQN
jgi:hypothetical protein